MAACKKCGRAVGCGCNLNAEGLCAVCSQKKRQSILPSGPVIKPNNPNGPK